MKRNLLCRSLVAPGLLAAAACLPAQTDPVVARIVDEGKNRNQVMRTLDELTHRVGPRLTGSPGLARAERWAMAKFKSYGCEVRLEKWGDVPVGFERGKRQVGRMVSPFPGEIGFTTMNWMPGTRGLQRGEAVKEPTTMAEFEAAKADLKGKWVMSVRPSGMRGPAAPTAAGSAPGAEEAAKVRELVARAGILGKVYGTRDDRIHSSGTWRDKTFEKRPTNVEIVIAKADYDRVVRNVEYGRKPVLEFDIENRWIKGPVPQYNVVADLKGTEKPEEMVIICGHLDSWNSPGSQGACDNGTGTSVALEAARILHAVGAKPKRTIRFVLWSGEEQGLLGSRAYVQTHKDELGKISAVLNDDGGTNYQGGYVGVAAMKEMMEAAFAPTVAAFPQLPMEFQTVAQMPQGGSSDHAPFNWEGVPGFFTMEKGRADYGRVWHTQYDRYEFAIPEYLVQSSTNHAVVAWYLANAPTLLPRAPKPPPRASARLDHSTAVGSDEMYEDPDHHHGKDHDHEDDWTKELAWRLRWTYQTLVRGLR